MEARTWEGTQRGRPKGVRHLLWHPPQFYPPDVVGGARITSAGPGYESTVMESWQSRDLPALAATLGIPVHFSLGDHERVWQSSAAVLAEIGALFSASARVAVHQQVQAGHNLSLGLTAMAYHLNVLAFVEECVVARRTAEARVGTEDPDGADELGGR